VFLLPDVFLFPQTVQSRAKSFGAPQVHKLRHTFAHTMEARGASVSEIRAHLGHSSLATTGLYLANLNNVDLENAQEENMLRGWVAPSV
jgi:integrase